MAQKLDWTSIALLDLDDIWKRVCDKGDEQEAAEQLAVIYREVERLPEFPKRFPMYEEFNHPDVREFKFSVYHVIYRLEKNGRILILSVFHTQRDVKLIMKQRRRLLL